MHSKTQHMGFTLVEAVISMVIVSVMLVATLTTLGSSAKARLVNASRQRGPALAQRLMAEILQCYYEDPDSLPVFGRESNESGSTRSTFDDVDDYNNWSASPPTTRSGATIANTTGWSQSVSVQYASLTNPTTTAASDTNLKRITVTITDPKGRATTRTALRSKQSGLDQAPSGNTTILATIGVELRLGGDSSTAVGSAADLPNRLTPPSTLPVTASPTTLIYPVTPTE